MTEAIPNLKYIIFFITLFIGVPVAYFLSLRFPIVERLIFFLLMFFTVRMEDINFVSREALRLSSRGFEIGLVDICTLILLLFIIKRKEDYHIHKPPGSWLYFAYFGFSALSIVNSAVPLFSFFELWKMTRMYIFFYVVYNYVNSFEQFNDFLYGVAAVTIYIFLVVLWQKYFLGMFQTTGPFPHQNSLVMYSIIFGSLIFAFLLHKKDIKFFKFSFWLLLFAMSTISVISTLSRAGLVLFALAVLTVLAFSFGAGISQKKIVITVLLFFLSIAIITKAWNSITERFETASIESANVRKDLAKAAVLMANKKVLGVGLNNFGVKINPPYTYGSHIPMHDPDDETEQNGLVETIYLMIAAESGWHTLVIFVAFIFYFFFLNIQNYFRYRNTAYQYFAIGLIGGLLAIYLESTLEWVLKQTNNFYQLMLVFAMIGVMSKLEKRYRKHFVKLPRNLSSAQRYARERANYVR
jgi:hypothetical protein